MDHTWKHLPCDLAEKICNMLPSVRRIDERLKNEIVNQWYLFDRYKYNLISFFNLENYEYIMYDDIKNFGITDDFPEDMCLTQVIEHMWMRLTPEQRKYLIYSC